MTTFNPSDESDLISSLPHLPSLPEEDQYAFIKDTNKPDRNVEYFWYLFKAVVINMGRDERLGRNFIDFEDVSAFSSFSRSKSRPTLAKQLEIISSHLNALQKAGEYGKIQDVIVNIFEDLIFAFLESPFPSRVGFERLLTFVKRWRDWADPIYTMEPSSQSVCLLYIGYVGYRCTKEERTTLFQLIRSYLEDGDANLGPLFDYGIAIGRPAIVDRIILMQDMSEYIMIRYGCKVSPRTRGFKLVRTLKGRLESLK